MMQKNFDSEFEFIFSRSSGAGGQHVNKTSTKVELRFNINTSKILNLSEKEIIFEKMPMKISNEGYIQIVSQETRSQFKNKQICIEKFYELIEEAFRKEKKRIKTKRTLNSILKRLDFKKQRKDIKERRKKI
jgi:ribosome-associated protein